MATANTIFSSWYQLIPRSIVAQTSKLNILSAINWNATFTLCHLGPSAVAMFSRRFVTAIEAPINLPLTVLSLSLLLIRFHLVILDRQSTGWCNVSVHKFFEGLVVYYHRLLKVMRQHMASRPALSVARLVSWRKSLSRRRAVMVCFQANGVNNK